MKGIFDIHARIEEQKILHLKEVERQQKGIRQTQSAKKIQGSQRLRLRCLR